MSHLPASRSRQQRPVSEQVRALLWLLWTIGGFVTTCYLWGFVRLPIL